MFNNDRRDRCRMYQHYVIVLVDTDDSEVTKMVHLRGYNELAVSQGRSSDAVAAYDNAMACVLDLAKGEAGRDEMFVELWGVPYPANGGANPNMEYLYGLRCEDMSVQETPGEEEWKGAKGIGPNKPSCRR